MNRRKLLLAGATSLAAAATALPRTARADAPTLTPSPDLEPIMWSEAKWRETLTPEEFAVLREEKTERPFTSPLNAVKEPGTFTCAGCDLPLYKTEWKFESGTGWPSFWQGIEGHLGTKEDRGFFMVRTEVHCGRCKGHLGHIFEDGPEPTGLRHCINGIAMDFVADEAAS